jgi:alginate O-acetyltransferase complex protein AlgI
VGLQHLQTVLLVGLGWVLFRAPTLPAAGVYFRALAGLGAPSDVVQLASTVTPAVVLALTVGVIGSTPILQQLRERRARGGLDLTGVGTGWLRDAAVLGLLFLSVLQVASGSYNPFIYFRF